jgi:hypothetical protein
MANKNLVITTVLSIAFMLIASTIGASATEERFNDTSLWDKANKIADQSEFHLPGVRRITYQETDGKGSTVSTEQAQVLIEGSHFNRFLNVREFGNPKLFALMDRYTDGFILSPFNDNLYKVEYEFVGFDEIIEEKSSAVYTFSMAYDAALPFYDPNYRESGNILGWDEEKDDFDGSVTGTVWLEIMSGTPNKMEISMALEDNTTTGTLNIRQTTIFASKDDIVLPTRIETQGSLVVKAGQKGKILYTNFQITEAQDEFWENPKFARGEIVN